MGNIKTYITYFDDAQIEEYGLKSDGNTVLFKGNDTSYSGDSINDMNTFFCELCTMYYIWKNNLKSDYVTMKQYRRPFDWYGKVQLPKRGEIICYKPLMLGGDSVITQFFNCHGSKMSECVINALKEVFGEKSEELNYFTRGKFLYTNNTFVIGWDDFVNMCEFVFKVINHIDSSLNLNYNYSKYMNVAKKFTEDGRSDYQTHWMAYIGERLVSCYIATKLHPLVIERLDGNGFYRPYCHKNQ